MTLPTSKGGTKKNVLDAAITGVEGGKNFQRNWKKLIEKFDSVAQTVEVFSGWDLEFLPMDFKEVRLVGLTKGTMSEIGEVEVSYTEPIGHQPAALAQLLKIHNCTQIMSVVAADNQYKLLLIKK